MASRNQQVMLTVFMISGVLPLLQCLVCLPFVGGVSVCLMSHDK